MPKRLSELPSLDLLRGFEAAARHLSFTLAAAELYLTQSAVSRQIATLEERLGMRLFLRRNRGLTLTDAGETLRAAVAAALRELDDGLARIRAPAARTLNVTASVAFSALWLVPRLPRFAREHPGVDVRLSATSALLDLARDRIDVAVRYCAPQAAPADAVELFGGDVVPVCAPKLLRDRARPLKLPADLRHHVLLHYDDPVRPMPWQSWSTWLEAAGVPDLKPAGSLHFSHLDHAVHAAVDGQGLALGIRSVLGDLLANRRLVIPFAQSSRADRGYYAILAPAARVRPEAIQFVHWLQQEVAASAQTHPRPVRPPARRTRRSPARVR
jgi:LysR family transcriptional regulator, glycine cleavage system transcriptional activator